MDHLSIRPSLTSMENKKAGDFMPYVGSQAVDDGLFRAAIGASEELLRKEELPNFLFFVFEQTDNSPGRQSAQTIRRRLGSEEGVPDVMMHLENVLTDLDGFTNEVYRTLGNSQENLIPRTFIDPWVVTESIPEPESRVQLVESRDPVFGQNQISLDWRVTSNQLDVFVRATEILAEEMGRLGFGRIWSSVLRDGYEWPSEPAHGKHHCGTVRMSNDPKSGVVDSDCRVHGISNLFIAGSSVFPTHGAGTPTLTIVALAVRLADHLKARMEAGSQ
jgi:choline dehydrogenase-like flavoprotein